MHHTVLIGSQLYKGAEVHDAYNLACKYHTGLNVRYNAGDDSNGTVDHSLIRTAYIYRTLIGNVNLNAGFLDDLVDYLALLSYHITDLLRINGDLLDLWSIWA